MSPDPAPVDLAVRRIVAQQFYLDVNEITRSTRFEEDLHADSLDIVELMTAFEFEMEHGVSDKDGLQFRTVGDVIDYFEGDDEGGSGIAARLKPPPDFGAGRIA